MSPESVAIYRRHNRLPIKLWSILSIAPHFYMLSIAAMFDEIGVYVFFRVVPANILLVVLLVWQRIASQKTRRALEEAGLAPEPWTPATEPPPAE